MAWYWWALIAGGAYLAFRGGAAVVMGAVQSYQVQQLAKAISIAEGTSYQDGTPNLNSLGMQRNNPGDIEDSMGQIITYGTVIEGWNALYAQCRKMLDGTSQVYQPSFTLMQTAVLYTGNDQPVAWARSVAQTLGLTINNTLQDVAELNA